METEGSVLNPRGIEASAPEQRATSWLSRAACRGSDIDFFPDGNEEERVLMEEAAKAICDICEVSDECYTSAVDNKEQYGVWGGVGEDERRKRRERWIRNARRARQRQV